MAFKDGQFHVVKQTNHFETFKYQFECLTCDWNDSFCKVKIHVHTVIRCSKRIPNPIKEVYKLPRFRPG